MQIPDHVVRQHRNRTVTTALGKPPVHAHDKREFFLVRQQLEGMPSQTVHAARLQVRACEKSRRQNGVQTRRDAGGVA